MGSGGGWERHPKKSLAYQVHFMLTQLQNSSPLNIRNDLRAFLNLSVSASSRITFGNKFQSLGPTREKARFPYLLLYFVSCSFIVLLESPYVIMSWISSGALCWIQLCTISMSLYMGLYLTLSQWKSIITFSNPPDGILFFETRRAAQFCTCCSFLVKLLFIP